MAVSWTRERLLQLASGYKSTCVLAAAAELDLFGVIGERSLTAVEIAQGIPCDLRGIHILLDACAAIGLLQKQGDAYCTVPGIDGLLTDGANGSVVAMVRHQANCLRRWAELARVVHTGRPVERTPSIRGEAADRDSFIGAMDNISGPIAASIIADLGDIEFKTVLDVGGASGTWTIAFLWKYAEANAIIFDLPPVCPMAKERIAAADLAERVSITGGDFYNDPLPTGADLIWLSAIIHQNSREQNRRLFAACRDALPAGGRLLIRDIVMSESRIDPPAGALFAINMLVATEGGGTFTLQELCEDLEASGFAEVSLIRRDPEWMNSVVAARRPS